MIRRAINFQPTRVPSEFAALWRDFTLASLLSSQPRNVSRVGNRLGSTYFYLYSSGAKIHEELIGIWSPDRVAIFLKSLVGEKCSPSTRNHIARDLNAMRNAHLGSPRKICALAYEDATFRRCNSSLQHLIEVLPERCECVNVVLNWIRDSNPTVTYPQAEARHVVVALKRQGIKARSRDLHSLRLAFLSTQDISGFSILETMPSGTGFPIDFKPSLVNFGSRQTRRLPAMVPVSDFEE